MDRSTFLTPFVEVSEGVYAKNESVNPSGSVKDRMAEYILEQAEKNNKIKPGDTIVEATSGNTGIAFSRLAAQKGYKMIVVMPCDMSEERKAMIKGYGAEIVEVGPGDFAGACLLRSQIVAELGAFCPDQFVNPENAECHEKITAPEILTQLDTTLWNIDQVLAFVAGTGTGGTLMGIGKGLRKANPTMQLIGVEPTESAVMSGGEPGRHAIQGIGDGFIPPIVDMSRLNRVISVSSSDAIDRMKKLSQENNLRVGISSGANVVAAERLRQDLRQSGIILTILPDSADRYGSMMG